MSGGLLDIAPQPHVTLVVRDKELRLRGLDMVDIAELFRRFPNLRDAFGTGEGMGADGLFTILKEAIPPIIAAGCGRLGDEEQEKAVTERLSAQEQLAAFGAILKLTMPDGPGPFVEAVGAALGNLLPAQPSPVASSGNSRKPSRN